MTGPSPMRYRAVGQPVGVLKQLFDHSQQDRSRALGTVDMDGRPHEGIELGLECGDGLRAHGEPADVCKALSGAKTRSGPQGRASVGAKIGASKIASAVGRCARISSVTTVTRSSMCRASA